MGLPSGAQGSAQYCVVGGVINYSLDNGVTWQVSGSPPNANNTSAVAVNQTNVTFSNLNGDVDQGYEMIGRIMTPASGTVVLSVQPNFATTNQSGNSTVSINGAVTAGPLTLWTIDGVVNPAASGCFTWFKALISTHTGFQRVFACETLSFLNGVSNRVSLNIVNWGNTTDVVTSLTVNSSLAGAIGAGSTINLRPLGYNVSA
jgi:hypothetical protein